MSKYTTGEIAKLCGVSVRTVQYYDSRNILVPTELSEGGRRLYSDEDLKRLQIICFLRGIGLSIDVISKLLREEHPENIIYTLLEEQKRALKSELAERQEKLRVLEDMQAEIKDIKNFTVDTIGDVARILENKKNRNKFIIKMVFAGIFMDVIQVAGIVYGFKTGVWWPFIAGFIVVLIMGLLMSYCYYKYMDMICPECHEIFKPSFREMFFAPHTPKLRKLTCPHCMCKRYCVEIYRNEEQHGKNY